MNEIITGSVTNNTAVVKHWDRDTRELKVYQTTGRFSVGEIVVGSANTIYNSGIGNTGNYKIMSVDYYGDSSNDYAQNKKIEEESDLILDFTERNPFGDY